MKLILCGSCSVEFALTDAMYAIRLEDEGWFHCPNGHQNRLSDRPDATSQLLAAAQNRNERLESELDEWKHAGRHCPICQQRVSQARSAEVAAHKLSLHLQQIHRARGALLALMPGETA